MKLLRFGEKGAEKPGLLDAEGAIRDLSGKIDDIAGDVLTTQGLKKLAEIDPNTLPKVEGEPRIGAPIGLVQKFLGIGLNYSDHAAETGLPVPEEPIVFVKASSCICGPNDNVLMPDGYERMDWEVELGVVIGDPAKRISEAEALDHVAGYTICNDVSERRLQVGGPGEWFKAKSYDTFGPMGPWVVTKDEIPDPQALNLTLDVNGERMQTGSTSTMIFNVAQLVAYISRFMTLMPGDVISTGTPPGVGMGRKPRIFLKDGDVMHLAVEGLGEQTQKLVRGN
ncbi:Ureidoglycolate lyase [Methyloligella halotolerans]|uniref:Ureidoglycolate lyase n=1 Tax=Methyloligella halotolerans TaxID=1177755 RepID=A0A1E2S3E2_9HYPH|nr:fumarylacetoacetate hydrolase family protein [Methyloligella halotolerans]ODA68922.1 Ureidoglycolate lyase [Methyloligella halotolerans]